MPDLSMPETVAAEAVAQGLDQVVVCPTSDSTPQNKAVPYLAPVFGDDECRKRLAACYSLLLSLARRRKHDSAAGDREPQPGEVGNHPVSAHVIGAE